MRRCKPIGVRFASKFAVDPETGCWNWTSTMHSGGYGQISRGRAGEGLEYAHRVSHELFIGPIPEGLEVDHLCRNTRCVNPLHLEAVTGRINVHRSDSLAGINARKTHCQHGHPLDGENLAIQRGRRGGEVRVCRICSRAKNREWWAANTEKMKAKRRVIKAAP